MKCFLSLWKAQKQVIQEHHHNVQLSRISDARVTQALNMATKWCGCEKKSLLINLFGIQTDLDVHYLDSHDQIIEFKGFYSG